jgi:HPt (histidine-containing phosphotransfer) domain-containing protein
MDVQMPEMDGLEASRALRRVDAAAGRRTPIIAMTAHAIKGDRERCIEAGMNDYISKPIDAENLHAMIERLTVPPDTRGAAADPPAPSAARALLEGFGNDWGFFKEVTEVFLDDYPQQLESLRRSLGDEDAPAFRRAAHSLRGMLRNYQAEAAADKAFDLEQKGLARDLEGAGPLIEAIADDLSRLERELRRILDDGPAG